MKYLFAIACVVIVAGAWADISKLNAEQEVKFELYGKECMQELNIAEEEAHKLRNKDFINPTDKLKCFSKCIFEKAGCLKDGVVQHDVALQKLSAFVGEERAKLIVQQCNNVKGDDDCDTAFKLFECYEAAKVEILA